MKRFITTLVTVGLLTVGTAGVAAAQTTGGGSTSSTSQPAGATGRHHKVAAGVLAVAAKTLGLKPKELASDLCGGQTVAQIASQHGKTSQDVVNAVGKAADARIDQAVKSGKLDPTKAAQRKAAFEQRVSSRIDTFKPSAARCQKLQGAGTSPTPSST